VRRGYAAALVVALLLLTGCSRKDALVLDGSPRPPDVEGVVTHVNEREIQLDGGRRYDLSRQLRSFSTYTLETLPVLQTAGRYVQLGLDDGTVTWVATIGAVITTAERVVAYTGELIDRDDDRLVFRDGTVLQLEHGVPVPSPPARVVVDLDPASHLATRVRRP
jgi:hypothetical protein